MRLLWCVGLAGCGRIGLGGVLCDIGNRAEKIAGVGATDCADDWACASDALATGTPFFMGAWVSDLAGDSVVHLAVAYDGVDAYNLSQHGNGEVAAQRCVSPSVGEDTGLAPQGLGCARFEPEGNHYRVCGRDGGQVPAPLPFP